MSAVRVGSLCYTGGCLFFLSIFLQEKETATKYNKVIPPAHRWLDG